MFIEKYMSSKLVTVREDAPIAEAVRLMQQRHLSTHTTKSPGRRSNRKTLVFTTLVIVIATGVGMAYGAWAPGGV